MTHDSPRAIGLQPYRVHTLLAQDTVAVGYFVISGDSAIAEAFATMPIDWVVLDMEASAMSKRDALHAIQALGRTGVAPFVRVSSAEQSLIEHALDVGAAGVLVPKVDSRTEAERVVGACRFPPTGRRGVNPVRASGYFADVTGYLANANDHVLCMVQIESSAALASAAEIASIPGIDVVFVGTGDLAMSLGHPGDVAHPDVLAACASVLEAARAASTTAGIFAYSVELARQYSAMGFRFIALGNEFKALRESVLATVGAFTGS